MNCPGSNNPSMDQTGKEKKIYSRPASRVTILHLITGTNVGGAEKALAALVRRSDALRYRHVVISMIGIGPVGEDLTSAGVEVHSLRMRRGTPSLTGLLRLVKLIRRTRPQILQCWMYHANLLGLVAGKLADAPYIIWGIRCSDMDFSRYRCMTRWVVKLGAWLSRVPQRIIANSESGKMLHVGLGYVESKIEVIPNGFDLEVFKPDPDVRTAIRKDLGLPNNALLIGLIARFDPMKDHATFFKAARLLSERQPGVHYVLAGSGVCLENQGLSKLVRDNNLNGSIHLLGPREDVPRLNASLDIACSSSLFGEGFSNAIGEAMACGVPCVATDVGDSGYIVGDTGRVVPPRDFEALAAALAELIQMGPFGRRALGERARQKINENFPLGQTVDRYQSLYEHLMDCSANGGLGPQSY